jgi:hypothetical protein
LDGHKEVGNFLDNAIVALHAAKSRSFRRLLVRDAMRA